MSKANTYRMCDYILSGDHEKNDLIRILEENKDGASRSDLREIAEEHIFFIAYRSLWGRGAARKEITEILNDL
jgi:hypothetical protein